MEIFLRDLKMIHYLGLTKTFREEMIIREEKVDNSQMENHYSLKILTSLRNS